MTNASTVPDDLWKVTIAPTGHDDPDLTPRDSFEFCREHTPQIIGVGWGVSEAGQDKGEALRIADEKYDGLPSPVKIFVKRMSVGDHAWIYDKESRTYYVCKIKSDWQHGEGGDWDRHDIHHYRIAEWREVPKPLVAGAITRRVTIQTAAQRMDVSEALRKYSALLYETTPSVEEVREELDFEELGERLREWDSRTFFAALDEDETEDLVGLYLQDQGWHMVKSSTGRSHPAVECQFQAADDGMPQTGYMQVKSGKYVSLDPERFRQFVDEGAHVFLFSTAENPYPSDRQIEGISTLPQDKIRSFALDNLDLLPYPMTLKLGLVSGVIEPSS